MNSYYVWMIASVVVASFSQILLKKGALESHASVVKEYLNPWVISGYALLAVSTLLTILALRGLELKNAPAIEALGYVLVLILSRVFFGEKITKRKVIGNLLILLGMVVFYLPS